MTRQQLFDKIKEKESFLCIGLDTNIEKIPFHLKKADDPLFEFNKQIIEATYKFAVAYKANIAFYEVLGSRGWEALEKTMEYMPEDVFTIADAKRADIGNTSEMYARAFFETLDFDSITVSPYMGEDSIRPFLKFERKWAVILAATSNKGYFDFQDVLVNQGSEKLYERVIRKTSEWGNPDNLMYVVGATRVESFIGIRAILPDHFLVIPGIGAQGGDLAAVCKYGMNKQCGLLVNSSRSIIYADKSKNFAREAGKVAHLFQIQMAEYVQHLKEFSS